MATGFTPSLSSSFSDKEKTNHTRLSRLLVDIGRCVLQDVFDSIHPPSSLHGVLNSAAVKNQLQRLRNRRILFDQQWNTLYTTSGIAESKNFDITLIFLLLRNICGLSPPAYTGSWDNEPLPADQSMEADLVRIKRCRNELHAHKVEMALTDDEFEKHWDDIKEVLNRLGVSKYKDQIEQLKFASMDHEKDMCFYALLHAWEESEIAMSNLEEALKNRNEEIIQEIITANIALIESLKHNQSQREFFQEEMQKIFRAANLEILRQIKELRVVVLENERKRKEIPDVDLYAAKLKKAITKQTDMQTKGIMNAESVKIDDIFTNLVVYYGKENIPRQRNKEDQRERNILTEIKKCSGIFTIDEDEQKNPKRIIVSGEPGIGKTMFSQKLVHDLATNNICVPKVNFTYLINFRELNDLGDDRLINLRQLLNLCPLLDDTAMIDEAVMEYMCENSTQLFIVLDGFDEYKDCSKILDNFHAQFPSCAKEEMPVAALVSKLIHKKILSDSVILVTSRPAEANQFNQKIHFDRFVKINGFTKDQVVEYVKKYFSSKSEELKNKALDRVLGSSLYMEFGRIPFRCYLMCIYIEHEITSNSGGSRVVHVVSGNHREFPLKYRLYSFHRLLQQSKSQNKVRLTCLITFIDFSLSYF